MAFESGEISFYEVYKLLYGSYPSPTTQVTLVDLFNMSTITPKTPYSLDRFRGYVHQSTVNQTMDIQRYEVAYRERFNGQPTRDDSYTMSERWVNYAHYGWIEVWFNTTNNRWEVKYSNGQVIQNTLPADYDNSYSNSTSGDEVDDYGYSTLDQNAMVYLLPYIRPVPSISEYTPKINVNNGNTITVTGTNLNETEYVRLYDNASQDILIVSFTIVSSTQLTFVVSNAIIGKKYDIRIGHVDGYGMSDQNEPLAMALPIPTISSFIPSSGSVGTTIDATGTGYNYVSYVQLQATSNGALISCSYQVYSDTAIRITAPSGMVADATYKIKIGNTTGSVLSTSNFTATSDLPVVTASNPTVSSLTANTMQIAWAITLSKPFTTSSSILGHVADAWDGDFYPTVSSGTSGTSKTMYTTHNREPYGYAGRTVTFTFRTSSAYIIGTPNTQQFTIDPQDTSEPSCLPAGTMITVAGGSLKPIEELVVGEALLSYDIHGLDKDNESASYVRGWSMEELTYDEVTANIVEIKKAIVLGIYNFNDGMIKSSDTHAHFIYDGEKYRFEKAMYITTGMSLVKQDGTLVEITSLEYVDEPTEVYEINVEDYDVYTAEGFITHNPPIKAE